jgi:uncharacterized protein YggE
MSSSLRSLIFVAIAVGFGLSLGAFGIIEISRLAGPFPFSVAQTTTQKQSTFDVTGTGKITTVPDKAVVNLGVTANDASVKAVQDKANTIINAIDNALAKLGIQKTDIQTDNYSLNPNYDYTTGSQKITGYTVNANLSVSVTDFSKLNQAIDDATAVGANQVGGVNFTLTDVKKQQVENDARKLAIDDAKQKAQDLAGLAGMRLGRIVNISETPQSIPMMPDLRAMPMTGGVGSSQATAPTNIEPGSSTFNYSVTLSYETL